MGVHVGLFVIIRMIDSLAESWIMKRCAHRIPGVDTLLVRMLDQRQGILFIENPILPLLASEAHGTQDNLGYLQARLSEAILRDFSAMGHSSWLSQRATLGAGLIPNVFHLGRHIDKLEILHSWLIESYGQRTNFS